MLQNAPFKWTLNIKESDPWVKEQNERVIFLSLTLSLYREARDHHAHEREAGKRLWPEQMQNN